MRVKARVDEYIDRVGRFEFIERQRSPSVRVLLTFLCDGSIQAIACWGILGWSLTKSLPADIGVGLGMAFIATLRERRRAREESELTR